MKSGEDHFAKRYGEVLIYFRRKGNYVNLGFLYMSFAHRLPLLKAWFLLDTKRYEKGQTRLVG
jgi:hypothetical protein